MSADDPDEFDLPVVFLPIAEGSTEFLDCLEIQTQHIINSLAIPARLFEGSLKLNSIDVYEKLFERMVTR